MSNTLRSPVLASFFDDALGAANALGKLHVTWRFKEVFSKLLLAEFGKVPDCGQPASKEAP